MIKSGGRSDFGIRQSPAGSSECPSELLRLQEAKGRIVSQSTAFWQNTDVTNSSHRGFFALRGAGRGADSRRLCAGTEFLFRGKTFMMWRCRPTCSSIRSWVWDSGGSLIDIRLRGVGATLRFLFGLTVAARRGCGRAGDQIRRSMWIGFGAGIAVALVGTALDFAWRGWPFLAGTLIERTGDVSLLWNVARL